MLQLQDRLGRTKRKLRVSLTDRCNYRCPYCMPEHPDWLPKGRLLSDAERFRLLRVFVTELGITHLRLTGGEPLLRTDLEERIVEFGALRDAGVERISLTTNGHLLAQRADALKGAGLDDLNVSLDALSPAVFSTLSGGRGDVDRVLDGILAARAAGLPVKLNTVVMRGYNEGELLPLARWAGEHGLPLRLIEFMPLDGGSHWRADRVVSEAEMLEILGREFQVEAEPETRDPARYYLLNGPAGSSGLGGRYRLGIISTISRPFCTRCDRLRITADGRLFTCLFSAEGFDLRTLMRQGAADADLIAAIRGQVWKKDAGYAATGYVERPITMHALGG
jgi:cyclic pyranopterin phosphate synthase